MATGRVTSGTAALPAYPGFAVSGGFWKVWGASIPAIRDQAGESEGQLGAASGAADVAIDAVAGSVQPRDAGSRPRPGHASGSVAP